MIFYSPTKCLLKDHKSHTCHGALRTVFESQNLKNYLFSAPVYFLVDRCVKKI